MTLLLLLQMRERVWFYDHLKRCRKKFLAKFKTHAAADASINITTATTTTTNNNTTPQKVRNRKKKYFFNPTRYTCPPSPRKPN